MSYDTISVIGLGYIGLPTAAVFASRQKKVVGVDVNQNVVAAVNRGEIHIVEPDLDIIVRTVVSEGWLRASVTPEPAEAFVIAVPTPFDRSRQPDLSFIEAAAKAVAPVLRPGNLVILESTSPVGATEKMAQWLAESRPDLTFPQSHGEESDIRIAHCPERVLPGHVLRELVLNDRIIGGMTPKCSQEATALYRIFVEGDCIVTNARTAEMCKLTENSFRDVNIAFANELSVVCDRLGIDVWELIRLANYHPRVNILQPGPGVGGHCIAVDPWFIISQAPEQARLIRTAREVNDHKPHWVIGKVEEAVDALLRRTPGRTRSDLKLACLGLTFKANIDDMRESPALEITEKLAKHFEGEILIVEPNIKKLPQSLADQAWVPLETAIEQADVLLLLVAHDQFKQVQERLRPEQVLFSATRI